MAPTILQKAERDRESVRTTIAYLESKLTAHLVSPIPENKIDHYMTLADAALEEITSTHKIIHAQAPSDLDPYNQEYMQLLDAVSDLQCTLSDIKKSFTPATTSTATVTSSEIRLPRIQLPTFSGKLQDWMAFRDLFVSAVHNNPNVSKAQKLTYLKTSLTGEAAMQIKSLSLSNANYDIAWAQLTERYQNDRELLFTILNRFINQPTMHNGSATGLRTLIDVSKECFRSLEVLKRPVDKWDDILMFHIFNKVDQPTKELWEQSLKDSSIPALKNLLDFLEQRARALAAGGTNNTKSSKSDGNSSRRVNVHHVQSAPSKCKVCSDCHFIFRCPKLNSMSLPERVEIIKKLSLCHNCLREGHSVPKCLSKKTCHTCNGRHHTLLHKTTSSTTPTVIETPKDSPSLALTHHTNDDTSLQQTLLATALVRVLDSHGQQHLLRALLDGGSTSSFVTDSCVRKLGLHRSRITAQITGLSTASIGTSKGAAVLTVRPHFNSENSYAINCLIMARITGLLPLYPCDPDVWSHLQGIQLADPAFHRPASIDILLGGDIFWNLLLDGKKTGSNNSPIGVRSTLGWLIAGNLNSFTAEVRTYYTDNDLDERLKMFWEIESMPTTRMLTAEEEQSEEHFQTTHTRDDSGRFIVQLPLKSPTPALGPSRDIAIHRQKQIERRLNKNPNHQIEYTKFMQEYISLGHMEAISEDQILNPTNPSCYIPHHFVLKESSTTTKFRVVFDASSKTATGVSLNDTLLVGPTIQDNLTTLLMRFRTHVVAFTADIAKMYRQIRVTPSDSDLQRIVWRENPTQPMKDFRLLTVTYGTASAPYLATKTLQQLAHDERESLPLASQTALSDFYVDDVMSGSRSSTSALEIQQQLLQLTSRGGFELRKWSSNCPALLEALPEELRETNPLLPIETDQTIKALGVFWNPVPDTFIFKLSLEKISPTEQFTKRKLLSEMAKIFDPLGWLAPVIIKAKILIQTLWKLQLEWDDVLPTSIQDEWLTFRNDLPSIEDITINRCMVPETYKSIHLVGFCDASELAYSAVIYLCVYIEGSKPIISIVTCKTRVAPAKTISLPKLELCGATLLANLMVNVETSLKITINEKSAWTDSTVVLDWIRSHPSRWKTFVANRVTEIQRLFPSNLWGHVEGVDNPADCASRGINPSELLSHPLWWSGSSWLQTESRPSSLPVVECPATLIEQKQNVTCCATNVIDNSIFQRYSSLRTLIRVTAYILRFYNNCRGKTAESLKQKTLDEKNKSLLTPTQQPASSTLTLDEKNKSLLTLIHCIQHAVFNEEIKCIQKNQSLPVKSKLATLNPFLDENQTLRVGGRLCNSILITSQKKPIVLPRCHEFTYLLIRSTHLDNHHAGNQLLLSLIQRNYWIIRAKDAIRHQVNKCVVCTRHRATTLQQYMGDLPAVRVTPSRPFSKCGVDYAGPFMLRAIPSRSRVTFKAYLAVFVCFSTKAMHLEIVSSLSTDAFLAALRRFISRRGLPTDMYSDCGTNFVGAAREIKDMLVLIKSSQHNQKIADTMSDEGVRWHFNPAGGPHFGGLWEAGVKSVKYHLHRIVGSARLTFEEMTTITTQIEAILNSRPLTALSTNPSDLSALTPGHFLIGAPLTSLPEPDIRSEKIGRLSRWQFLQQLQQNFWHRWSNEYLSRLQQRPKWLKQRNDIKVGDLLLIKDDRLPPSKWKLGRVTELHPGADGLTRVVSLKTEDGNIKRPLVKLCLLSIISD